VKSPQKVIGNEEKLDTISRKKEREREKLHYTAMLD